MGQKMDLDFQLSETTTLFITTPVVAIMLQVGSYKETFYIYLLK
jgi:hypothetical protein